MPKPDGSGNGGGGGKGGGGSVEFAILGLNDESDLSGDGDATNDTTDLATGFVIEGTIDPAVLADPNFVLTVIVDGVPYMVPEDDIDSATGAWTFLYGGENLSGAVTVEAEYTYTHPKNGKLLTQTTEPYTFTIEGGGGVNTAPSAVDDTASIAEDVESVGNVLVNDSDADGDALSVTMFEIGTTTYGAGTTARLAEGDLTLNGDGSWTFTPAANYNGPVPTVTYWISDGTDTSTASLNITVDPVNDAPVAVDDVVSTDEDTPLTIVVIANDTDVDGDPLVITSATNGANGTVTVNADGTVTYTPNAGFNGQDSFTYDISDGKGGTDTATVTITVNPVNDAPDAIDDTAATDWDNAVIISVLANDSDPEGDSLIISAVTQPISGTVTDNGDGTLTYTPDSGFAGDATFTYTVSDGNGGTDTATVTVTVSEPEPTPPADPYNDPLYGGQWHLGMIGDIGAIWDSGFTGAGVSVGVYDNGIDYTHEDLWDNYDSSKHVWVNGTQLDPAPSSTVTAEHGTAVAGVIAAVDNNVGGVGVAFGASLTGVNIFGGPADINGFDTSGFSEAIGQAYTFDIINNSWGNAPDFNHENQASTLAALAGFERAVQEGRNFLGTIIVKAAGNDWDSSQEFLNVTRYSIAVAAHDQDGDASWYTNRGANLLVSAPSSGSSADGDTGILTTDVTGGEGYEAGNYTTQFGGTSSAAPVVSGVAALMLEANPDLGWRDVQTILAYSSQMIGENAPATAPVPNDSNGDGTADSSVDFPVNFFDWFYNAADNWNGGGLHFSEDYGYGAVDAYAATRMAEVWSLFDSAQVYNNEERYAGALATPAQIFGTDWLESSWTYDGQQMELEYVEVYIDFTAGNGLYGSMTDISVEIVSAEQTTVSLMQASDGYDSTNRFLTPLPGFEIGGSVTWTYGINAFRGEDVTGDWTVRIVDSSGGDLYDGGTLNEFQFRFYGAAPDNDDVYHYTDEVFETLASDATRIDLSDAQGTDWLNAAAMTGNISLDLATGGSVGGISFVTFAAGTQIENAVSGDGNDQLTGTSGANHLVGMRGDDLLNGLGGDDVMTGGAGSDTFVFIGLFGSDRITDFEAGAGAGDVLDLTALGEVSSLQEFLAASSEVGGNAVYDLGQDGVNVLQLDGVSLASLAADDFLFGTV